MEIIKRNFEEFCEMYGQDSSMVKKVWDTLGYHDCWLGGGAIRRTLIGQPLDSDFDFFFVNADALESFKDRCDKAGLAKVKETKHHIQFEGKLEGSELPIVVQAIFFKYYYTRFEVLDSFDYTITQFLYDGEYMWTTPEALWDLGRKRLVIHKVSYPVATMRRMLKYTNQGFTACAGCMKTLFAETANNPDAMAELDIEYVDWPTGGLLYIHVDPYWCITIVDVEGTRVSEIEDIEPVAVAYNYDGYGYQYIDNGSGPTWLERGKSYNDAVVLVDLEDVVKVFKSYCMDYITLFGELQNALEELKGLKDE